MYVWFRLALARLGGGPNSGEKYLRYFIFYSSSDFVSAGSDY
jgi:hypothetical protein